MAVVRQLHKASNSTNHTGWITIGRDEECFRNIRGKKEDEEQRDASNRSSTQVYPQPPSSPLSELTSTPQSQTEAVLQLTKQPALQPIIPPNQNIRSLPPQIQSQPTCQTTRAIQYTTSASIDPSTAGIYFNPGT
jgi:hypothetical protein